METAYDWVSLAIFGGLVVLFLERSSKDQPSDHLLHYLIPAVGCAFANYAGNHGNDIAAIAILIAIGVYVQIVLKPFSGWPSR